MVRLAWFLLALIHALPAIALVRPALLTSLYGVEPIHPPTPCCGTAPRCSRSSC